MEYKRSLFLFRRDLRLEDNTALIEALKSSEKVILAFIFDPRQVKQNPYFSAHAFDFMLDALAQIKPYCFEGVPEEVLPRICKQNKIEAVFANADYTPFALKRDAAIKKKVPFHLFDDALLHPPGAVLKANGEPYTVFTPFYNASKKLPVAPPQANRRTNYFRGKIEGAIALPRGEKPWLSAKRIACQALLRKHYNYAHDHDLVYKEGTTHLSAYNKFGICSIREVYKAIKSEPIRRQLYWRDFFTHISYFFPHVYGSPFKKVSVSWRRSKADFEAWCNGMTGLPIVDAGMRQLNETGWMHNRARLIVGSFLTKDLQIDWRWGERYFANQLIDYDPAVNNGNWQWVASTGCDAQPYFRIFNPWTQQKRFDPECIYIKKWIPELKHYSPKEIHNWEGNEIYPGPMVNHDDEAKRAKAIFK